METVVTHAAEKTTDQFLNQGILGAVCLIAVVVACFFYREKGKVETRERELYDRHVATSEKWNEKYHELARDMRSVLDSLSKRM